MAKALFIEDDPGWQDILHRLLDTAGHESQRATNFESAIGILNGKKRFDVIVFDLRLGEKSANSDQFVWLDALIQGILARHLRVPPIIIVTGVDITKKEIVQAFTEYRGYVFSFFEKKDFNPKDFMQSIKNAVDLSPDNSRKSRSGLQLLAYTLLMTAIMLATFGVLIWSVKQVSDPQTQQTILQVGGAVLVVIAVFITVFSQNTKLENVIDGISKIFRG
jgi:DNA-binding NtrC family response regulator